MSTEKAGVLAQLDDFCWIRLRTLGGRLSPALARVLGDGDYLTAWRVIGALALPLALLIGFWFGHYHFAYDPPERPLYLYSLVTLVALVVLSQNGAAVGAATWVGFAAGSLLRFYDHPHDEDLKLLAVLGAWALSLTSLWILLVATPMASRQLGGVLSARLGERWRNTATSALLYALLQFFFVYLWCQSTPTLLQPVYLWQDMTPMTHGLVQTMHKSGWAIAMVAAYAGAMRIVFQAFAQRDPQFLARRSRLNEVASAAAPPPGMARTVAGAAAKAAFMTFLMSSFIPSWKMALLTFVVLGLVLEARAILMGQMGLGAPIAKIPIYVRLPGALLLIAIVSYQTVKHFWDTPNFMPPLWATVISVTVCAVLLPPPSAAKKAAPARRAFA